MPYLTSTRYLFAKQQTPALEFTPKSPEMYSEMLLEQAGIKDLRSLKNVLLGDAGSDVEVTTKKMGLGLEFKEVSSDPLRSAGAGWLVCERFASEGGPIFRARVFRTFEGAAAEFSIRLKLRDQGEVSLRELSLTPGAIQLTFRGAGGAMVMAPMEAAVDAGAALRF